MKHLIFFKIFLLCIIFSTPSWSKLVIYCTEEISAGINKKSSNSRPEFTKFKPDRFSVLFEDGVAKIQDIPYQCKEEYKKVGNPNKDVMNCKNFGRNFLWIPYTSEFSFSQVHGPFSGTPFSLYVSYGRCEKF